MQRKKLSEDEFFLFVVIFVQSPDPIIHGKGERLLQMASYEVMLSWVLDSPCISSLHSFLAICF
jgi:hypothetical protein